MNARTFYRTPIIFFSIHPLLFDAAAWVVFFNKTYEADILVFFFAISSFIFPSKKKKKKKENVYAVALLLAPRPWWWARFSMSHFVRQGQNERFSSCESPLFGLRPFSLVFSGPNVRSWVVFFSLGLIPYATFILWFNPIWLLCDAFRHCRVISSFLAGERVLDILNFKWLYMLM